LHFVFIYILHMSWVAAVVNKFGGLGLNNFNKQLDFLKKLCTRVMQASKEPWEHLLMINFSTPDALQKASSGSTMATKPGVVSTSKGGATGSGATAGGAATVGTAVKGASKAKPEVDGLWVT